jgi:hypothetical protein
MNGITPREWYEREHPEPIQAPPAVITATFPMPATHTNEPSLTLAGTFLLRVLLWEEEQEAQNL